MAEQSSDLHEQNATIEALLEIESELTTSWSGVDELEAQLSRAIQTAQEAVCRANLLERALEYVQRQSQDVQATQRPAASPISSATSAEGDLTFEGKTAAVFLLEERLSCRKKYLIEELQHKLLSEGFQWAKEKTIEFLETFKCAADINRESLVELAQSLLRTRPLHSVADHVAQCLVDAVWCVRKDGQPPDLRMVEVQDLIHECDMDIRLVRGRVVIHNARHPDMVKSVANAFILTCSATLEYNNESQFPSDFHDVPGLRSHSVTDGGFEEITTNVHRIIKLKKQVCPSEPDPKKRKGFVVINKEEIDESSLNILASAGIVALCRVDGTTMERLRLDVGGKTVNNFEALSPEILGYAGLVHEDSLGVDKYTTVEDCRDQKSVTILIKANEENNHMIVQIKAAICDCVNEIQDLYWGTWARAFKVAAHENIKEQMRDLSAVTKIGANAYANALLVDPKTLKKDGEVKFVISDKTGTITRHVMNWKRCSVGGRNYGQVDGEEFNDPRLVEDYHVDKESERARNIRELLTMMAVCHTVVPEHKDGKIIYQSSSPDEGALVRGAASQGVVFHARQPHKVVLKMFDAYEEYQVLDVIDFTSDRKRMSVVVRDPSGKLKLYCKGADTVIFERVAGAPNSKEAVEMAKQHMENYAAFGYRTLCFAVKEIDEASYTQWAPIYKAATLQIDTRKKALEDAAELIEEDMTLVGATAIEDRLQEKGEARVAFSTTSQLPIPVVQEDEAYRKTLELIEKDIERCQLIHANMVLERRAEEAETKLKLKEQLTTQGFIVGLAPSRRAHEQGRDITSLTSSVGDTRVTTDDGTSQLPDGTWRQARNVMEGYVPQEEQPVYNAMAAIGAAAARAPEPITPMQIMRGFQPARSAVSSRPMVAADFITVSNASGDKAKMQLDKVRKNLDDINKLKEQVAKGDGGKLQPSQLEKIQREDELMAEMTKLEEDLEKMGISTATLQTSVTGKGGTGNRKK